MIFNKKQLMLAFKELGWKTARDEVGDSYCLYIMADRIVHAMPRLGKVTNGLLFDSMVSISTPGFSRAEAQISDEKESHAPITVSKYKDFELMKPLITFDDVKALSDQMIGWAQMQNTEKGLEGYRCLPTDSKGLYPLHHLAALAINGDVEKLKKYQASFAKGDRLGFVPYITKEYIDRAVVLAEQHQQK